MHINVRAASNQAAWLAAYVPLHGSAVWSTRALSAPRPHGALGHQQGVHTVLFPTQRLRLPGGGCPLRRRRGGTGVLVTVAATLLTTIACSPSSNPPTDPKEGFIAVVGAGQDDPLWPVLRGSALRHQGVIGEIPLRVEAPPMVSSHAQSQLIRKLRGEGMRGLCIQVIDPKAIAPQLKRLANEGTAVVTMMHPVQGPDSPVHCGVDQVLVGRALADSIAETLGGKGTIAVVHANARMDYLRERYDAFRARLERYPRIMVLREFDCGGNAQRAQEMMRRCMKRFPRLNGWVALDNWPLRGLDPQERLLPSSCKLVTTDPNPQLWDHLSAGTCWVMIAADYDQIAEQAVLQCATALEGRIPRWRTFFAEPRPIRAADLFAYKTEWMHWCARQAPFGP